MCCGVTPRWTALAALIFLLWAPPAGAAAADQGSISVSLSQKKARRGEKVSVTIRSAGFPGGATRAALLKPTVGAEELALREAAGRPGLYLAERWAEGRRVAVYRVVVP